MLPGDGERRVPGLRREEVALLAGVSVDYYTKLERGTITSASDGVLDAVARALQLDDAERTHLFDLFRPSILARGPRPAPTALRESLQRMLDSIAAPALAYDARQDIVGANLLGRAMFARAARDVHEHRHGRKVFHHPEVGQLEADHDVLDEPGLSLTTYTAPAGSPTVEKFTVLASWVASGRPDG